MLKFFGRLWSASRQPFGFSWFQIRQRIGCHDNIIIQDDQCHLRQCRKIRLCNWIRFLKINSTEVGSNVRIFKQNGQIVLEVLQDLDPGTELVATRDFSHDESSPDLHQDLFSRFMLGKLKDFSNLIPISSIKLIFFCSRLSSWPFATAVQANREQGAKRTIRTLRA